MVIGKYRHASENEHAPASCKGRAHALVSSFACCLSVSSEQNRPACGEGRAGSIVTALVQAKIRFQYQCSVSRYAITSAKSCAVMLLPRPSVMPDLPLDWNVGLSGTMKAFGC